ncbi:hypothetical protein [Lacinutrix undariae]
MKDFNISNREKLIVVFVMAIPMLFLFGYVFYEYISDDRTAKERFLESVIQVNFIGTVDSIYRQKMNHNTMVLKSNEYEFYVPGEWENYFKVGDSISKHKGQLILEHYRNSKLIRILDYNKLN